MFQHIQVTASICRSCFWVSLWPVLANGIAPASPGFIDNQDGLILDSFESISMPESKYVKFLTTVLFQPIVYALWCMMPIVHWTWCSHLSVTVMRDAQKNLFITKRVMQGNFFSQFWYHLVPISEVFVNICDVCWITNWFSSWPLWCVTWMISLNSTVFSESLHLRLG